MSKRSRKPREVRVYAGHRNWSDDASEWMLIALFTSPVWLGGGGYLLWYLQRWAYQSAGLKPWF